MIESVRPAGRRAFVVTAACLLGITAALAAWLLFKPGPSDRSEAIANWIELTGSVVTFTLVAWGTRALWRPPHTRAARWSPRCLLFYLALYTLGQLLYTIYSQILHQSPFPSWADAAYLSDYPFFVAGVVLLPARAISHTARLRLVSDGLLVMAAVAAFSWYFVLGPTVLQSSNDRLADVVGTAYPLGDLLEAACLFLLVSRPIMKAMRPTVLLLAGGTFASILCDSIFDVQSLQGTYVEGSLLEAGWTLAISLIGLAVLAAAGAVEDAATEVTPAPEVVAPVVWKTLQPYAGVPAVGVLIWGVSAHGKVALQPGMYLCAAVLTTVVLIRQILATHELASQTGRTLRMNRALAAANTQLEALATTDPLTGLPNHRAMVNAVELELARAQRYSRSCAVLFLDLDHFKAVNDSYGHAAGDVILRDLATVMRRGLRGTDTVGRWGGEEFLMLLPETDTQAAQAAERVRAAVSAHSFPAAGGIHLTCSIGVAVYPADGTRSETLVEAADRAMYDAKHLGRNRVRVAGDSAGQAGNDGSREEATVTGTVEALAALVDARDSCTARHTICAAELALCIARVLHLDTGDAHMVKMAARLHDVGMVAMPDAVLRMPEPHTAEERAILCRHSATGAEVVGRVPALRGLAPVIRAHHERWDGKGYPDGLAEEDIPLAARIVAVVDEYDALTTHGPSEDAMTPEEAVAEIRHASGSRFDPDVVAALEDVVAVGLLPDCCAGA